MTYHQKFLIFIGLASALLVLLFVIGAIMNGWHSKGMEIKAGRVIDDTEKGLKYLNKDTQSN